MEIAKYTERGVFSIINTGYQFRVLSNGFKLIYSLALKSNADDMEYSDGLKLLMKAYCYSGGHNAEITYSITTTSVVGNLADIIIFVGDSMMLRVTMRVIDYGIAEGEYDNCCFPYACYHC